MAQKLSIALFIPTYNVQGEIIPVLRAIPIEVLERLGKVYIIDNGSTDKTIDEIKVYLESQNNSKFELYQNKVNEMLGGSTINAFNKSMHDDINFLICLHGDGQAKPKDLKQFIKKIDCNNDLDFILGSRFLSNSKVAEYSLIRLFFNKVFCYLQWLIIQQKVYDLGAFIGFNINTIKQVDFQSLPRDMGYHPYLILVICKKLKRKIKFAEFPISWGEVKSTNINVFSYGLVHLKKILLLLGGVVLYKKVGVSSSGYDIKIN